MVLGLNIKSTNSKICSALDVPQVHFWIWRCLNVLPVQTNKMQQGTKSPKPRVGFAALAEMHLLNIPGIKAFPSSYQPQKESCLHCSLSR